jgi:hypothetical protein
MIAKIESQMLPAIRRLLDFQIRVMSPNKWEISHFFRTIRTISTSFSQKSNKANLVPLFIKNQSIG